jgi:A/G-specific adenine glycosylase
MGSRFHNAPGAVNGKIRRAVRRDLLRWYRRHRRVLPWRNTRDPYAIWVSEVMLQQTRVEVVRDYYARWLRAFPTVDALARAPYPRVLKLWEGLGYYRRAKNLHRAAKILVRRARRVEVPDKPPYGGSRSRPTAHLATTKSVAQERDPPNEVRLRTPIPGAPRPAGSAIPATAVDLERLPGVGRYTAAAIASIAFGERVAVVDGNVARVLARLFGLRADVTKPAPQERLWSLAEALLPARGGGDFNQALMELGALVCTPGEPDCARCPVRGVCVARARGIQAELPNRGPRRRPRRVVQDAAWVCRGGRFLLRRRPSAGLLAGLWELPPLNRRPGRLALTLDHAITHRRITLRVFESDARHWRRPDRQRRWVNARQARRLPLAAAHRRAVDQLSRP